jgi:hypothetical protein
MGGGGLTSFASSVVFLLEGFSVTLLFLRGGADVGVGFLFDVSFVIFLGLYLFRLFFEVPLLSKQM